MAEQRNSSTNTQKAKVIVRADGVGSLAAVDSLSYIDNEKLYHTVLDKRHPLGIYNVSILRICKKIKKCCEKFEKYIVSVDSVADLVNHTAQQEEILDYLELCLYAAAEHVDDIESVASCFFANKKKWYKSKDVRELKRSIKPIRDRLSAFANALKHNQSRIRIFSLDFVHERRSMCLHGFFIESFKSGTIGPCPILHSPNEKVISVTSFMWDIVIFVFEISVELTEFLDRLSVARKTDVQPTPCTPYSDAVLALARLPTYCFDEMHPFDRVSMIIERDETMNTHLNSGIYGSLRHPWTKSTDHQFGGHAHGYDGDGVTCSFALVQPSSVKLMHWTGQ